MQTRKKRMHDLADGLIALPGGFGTLDELFEALTWAQLGLHQKPIGILNLEGFFDPMFLMIEHAAVEGFIYPEHKNLLVSSPDPEELLRQNGSLSATREPGSLGQPPQRGLILTGR